MLLKRSSPSSLIETGTAELHRAPGERKPGLGPRQGFTVTPGEQWLTLPPGATYSNTDSPLQGRIWAVVRSEQPGDHAVVVTVLALVEHELALSNAAPPVLLGAP